MSYHADISGTRYRFGSLAQLLANATALRSGDVLAGVAAETSERRVAARWALSNLPLSTFLNDLVVPYETDEVSRLIIDTHDADAFSPISHLTVGAFREWLLDDRTDGSAITAVSRGLTPEMVAAVSKLMRNQDLVSVAQKIEVVTRFRNTIGLPKRLSVRLQPNHPTDDPKGVAASILDGLMLGSGDAVIGINPAGDDVENIGVLLCMLDEIRLGLEIPTQSCVLTHVTNSLELIGRGAPLDLCFQSIAGTEAANRGFGISLGLLREAWDATLSLGRGTIGTDVMYFETGQGSCLSSDSHHGVDQQTLECRAYEVARQYRPLLVNSVVGFIGPEYLYDGKQILRAALEDHFCGKLLGLPMGLDICYTNHAEADQDDMDVIATVLGVAGVSFIMGIPGADDVMLGYQSTSFHDALYLRQVLGLRPAPEFEAWLCERGLVDEAGRIAANGNILGKASVPALEALYD
ncbi:ethanolamine ammonia-lyase large subunit [Sphingobium sp. B1D7B]|uniref:ethanolamine ammonia-lyase subunit EutB n=1 Tax=Sphingobium sp. B1D7B TaxID=2940578 RepID=UPI002225988E|nr:ethanolamine ammonia-lyase subunit EutB [Sphingobium sp. B1D7B]MCW2406855.1 ethanolamine ammonia-lyase large subunit [Sphingobium sp. B1D7B]